MALLPKSLETPILYLSLHLTFFLLFRHHRFLSWTKKAAPTRGTKTRASRSFWQFDCSLILTKWKPALESGPREWLLWFRLPLRDIFFLMTHCKKSKDATHGNTHPFISNPLTLLLSYFGISKVWLNNHSRYKVLFLFLDFFFKRIKIGFFAKGADVLHSGHVASRDLHEWQLKELARHLPNYLSGRLWMQWVFPSWLS